jgi:putative protease
MAAVAAGADAVYCGLKIFSARMEADNFSIEELSRLTALARANQVQVYIAFNSLVKESEQEKVFNILQKLCRYVDPDALIIQDLSLIPLAKEAGFTKEFHLSTLANCTSPTGLDTARTLGMNRVVLPREFTIDDIKAMADHAAELSLELEVFVHGALCYSISGRCYWSSWFGGKSSLRGRCVQPCRRIYEQQGLKKRHFSCLDFSADVLAKVLKQIPQVTTWKIEGRKKSPHYVYYTTKAYRLLRDDPTRKKEAMGYLDYAMGRPFSHYHLLTQRKINPLSHGSETGSGRFAGRIKNPAEPYFITREPLFHGDLLRIGYEDEPFHDICKVTRAVPKKGQFFLPKNSRFKIKKGTPVYLIDRRDKELVETIKRLENELHLTDKAKIRPGDSHLPHRPSFLPRKVRTSTMNLNRGPASRPGPADQNGIWISGKGYRVKSSPKAWHWLDPLIFPSEEHLCARYIDAAIKKGAENFVINAVWQLGLFTSPKKLNIWAGPFCNIANTRAIDVLAGKGIAGVIVSPELDQETYTALPGNSRLPLGIVIHGNWPLGISRVISDDLKLDRPFQSPMGETAWITKRNSSYHVYPNWPLDLRSKRDILEKAGYSLFVDIKESIPKGVKMKKRQGLWNWNLKLL